MTPRPRTGKASRLVRRIHQPWNWTTASEDHVVSSDGKTLTITRKGVGVVTKRAVDDLLVYERQ